MVENDFVSIWLEENGNPAIEELTRINIEVATKARQALAEQGLGEKDLAVLVDIHPEEITRWLNGRHPFSVKVLELISTKIGAYSNLTSK